jgi:NADH-quinone oxidoreductase subunit J
MSVELGLFWLFAVLTVASSVGVIVSRNAIGSAMSLVAAFFFLAGIYVLLWAHTIAVLQILVYAGAIMVLFLFVIMLLSINDLGQARTFSLSRGVGGGAAVGLGGVIMYALWRLPSRPFPDLGSQTQTFGTLKQLGEVLYTSYLLPFEVVSLLLLVAIVGAVVVAKSRV